MYGASVGDTGIFGTEKLKGVVRAIAVWSPFENVIVFFVNNDFFYTHSEFQRSKIVLTEKRLDFKISSYYRLKGNINFCGDRPKFVELTNA